MLVSASALPAPTDAGPVSVGVGSLIASPSDLYFTVYVVQTGSAAQPYLPGSVMRVPLAGGQPAQVLAGYLFGQPLLAAKTVLFLARGGFPTNNPDAIFSVPVSGGPASMVLALPTNDTLLNGVATDGAFVYFGDQRGLEATPLASDSGAADMITVVPGALTDGIGVFGQELMFTQPQGAIESVPLPPPADSQATILATSGAAPVDLTSCGSLACWLDEGSNSLDEMNPLGGAVHKLTLSGSLAIAYTFTFDGADFYVVGMDSSQVVQSLARVSGGGCPVTIVTMPPGSSTGVAVDDECVYWSNSEGIFSLAKSAQGPFHQ